MGQIVFVTGPVRSGKSRFALELAQAWGRDVVYAATYQIDPRDEEMEERVRRHRAERPATWRTLEAPGDPVAALSELSPPPSGLILDCLTLWLAGRLESSDGEILEGWKRLLAFFRSASWSTVIVGNEVGWSLVPADPKMRRFRDLAGWLAQATARESSETHLCVAGYSLRVK
ncbi:MAG TPA: bifunctional adenosylcobinamide kinase/adenosylcobinamide-phosphate guanylyltransferase [Candidatus Methylomirabilis sp.]